MIKKQKETAVQKRSIYVCIALMLAAIAVFGVIAQPVSAAGHTQDLSRPASAHNGEITAADLVARFYGDGISEEEQKYLEKHGGVSISLDFGITTAYVVTEYSDGTLSVGAREYSYTAADGTAVTWIPATVRIGDISAPLLPTADEYRATLTNLTVGEDAYATVDYTLDISVPTDVVNSVLNLAYNNIADIKAEIEAGYAEYDRLLAEYETGVIAEAEYLRLLAQYEADYAAYTSYLSAKKIYDDASKAYSAYLTALGEYNAAIEREEEYKLALEEYNRALAAYTDYITALDLYEIRLAEYQTYTASIAIVREQLLALDAFYLPMTDDRTVAGAINGGLVTEVLETNRDLIEGNAFKVPACLIDDAAAATKELRTLLADYNEVRNGSETDKYIFYINHYAAFRDNTILLLQALDELYNYDKIRSAMNLKDSSYPRKYEILVSQLVIIANALNNGPVYTYWRAYHDTKCTSDCTLSAHKPTHEHNKNPLTESSKIYKTTVKDMLGGNPYLSDTENATPLAGGVPVEVTEPIAPTPVEKPTKPTAPTVPAKPTEVANPGDPPTEVTKPTSPTPAFAPDEPTPYVPCPDCAALVAYAEEHPLTERKEVSGDCIFTATTGVKKSLFNVTSVTVFFYSEDGEFLYSTAVDKGTRADYVGITPEKAEDARATYTFSHWVDKDGNTPDLSAVEADVSLYPCFTENIKSYPITFTVDGVSTTVLTPYGSMPVPTETPHRPDDSMREYTFTGWDKPIAPVTGGAEYTAVFSGSYILPLGFGGAEITDLGDYIYAKCSDPFTTTFDLSGVIARAIGNGNTKGIVLDTGLFDLTFTYATLIGMAEAGDTTVSITKTVKSEYSYSYLVRVGEGNHRVNVTVDCSLRDGRQLRLYHITDTDRVAVPYTYAEGKLEFTATAGITYCLAEEYELGFIANPIVTVTVPTGTVAKGTRIPVSATVPDGISLDRIYLVYPDGSEVDVTDGYFLMPDCDVTVCVKASYIEYTVTFVNADSIIAVYKHRYGDTVTPPANPSRPNDGTYRYIFACWSSVISPVTEDITYTALYEKILLPKADEPTGLRISDTVLGLIIAAGCLLFMMLTCVIPAGITATVLTKRERRKYLDKKKRKDAENKPEI